MFPSSVIDDSVPLSLYACEINTFSFSTLLYVAFKLTDSTNPVVLVLPSINPAVLYV